MAAPASGPTAPIYEFWHVDHLNDAFFDGKTTYLDVSKRGEFSTWWDPLTERNFAPSPSQISSAHRHLLSTYEVINLPGGGSAELHIKGTGAKCGYTVGVWLNYSDRGQPSQSFYVIEHLSPPRVTHYCGEAVLQNYDAALVSAEPLSDGRLMVIDYVHSLVVVLKNPPDEVVTLGKSIILVPGRLLQPALDAAGDSQQARYAALLNIIKIYPGIAVSEQEAQ